MFMNATYSPDDNKLRLYASTRLDKELYQRVKDTGFIWAPKQEFFVAPKWTPERADLLIELCGEIGDEDTSLTERAEDRAERFEEYSEKRATEAQSTRDAVASIAKRFEFGQPILVGHHSERKARKDAERMQNGMRKSIDLWKTSDYWVSRAKGAIRHAKYKERSDVRARRIKGIEADMRKAQRTIDEVNTFLPLWKSERLTQEKAMFMADRMYLARAFPLAEFPRELPASQYEGNMGLYSALKDGIVTMEQARGFAVEHFEARFARASRWVEHYQNRLAYERGMLAEAGGLAADGIDMQAGGRVLVDSEWNTILRITKREGKIVSVLTTRRFVPRVQLEEIKSYEEPSEKVAELVKTAMKKPPLCNYPGEGFTHITKAKWDECPSDYRGTMCVIKANDQHAEHRTRKMLGVYAGVKGDDNARHRYASVFITDAKIVEPPRATPAASKPNLAEQLILNEPVCPPVATATAAAPVAAVQEGSARAAKPSAEEMQAMKQTATAKISIEAVNQLFNTPGNTAAYAAQKLHIKAGMSFCEPNGGGGNLLQAVHTLVGFENLPGSVTIEINSTLAMRLLDRFPGVKVECGDFLEFEGQSFDRILMNPPFENAADIKHMAHAFKLLSPGGRLVAICAAGPRQATWFADWAKQAGDEWEALPRGTFEEEGTGVNTAIVTLNKPA